MGRLKQLPGRLKELPGKTRPLPSAGGAHASFYQSSEFRAWRTAVKNRDGWRCVKCGATGPRLTADHIIEVVDGGSKLDPANGMTLCQPCSNRKTAAAKAARLNQSFDRA